MRFNALVSLAGDFPQRFPIARGGPVGEEGSWQDSDDHAKVFKVSSEKNRIVNTNQEYLDWLSTEQVKAITAVLEEAPDVMEHYGNELMG